MRVGDADHRDLLHRGVGADDLLHLAGRDVLAPGDDHVHLPVDDGEVPVGVEPAQVAGVEPPAGEGLVGGGGVAPVAGCHLVAPHDDLPVVEHPDRDQRAGPARGPQQPFVTCGGAAVVVGVEEGGVAGELGHAVALVEPHRQAGHRPAQEIARDAGRAVPDVAQRPQVAAVGFEVVEQGADHRRRQRHRRHRVLADRGHHRGRVEPGQQDDRSAVEVEEQDVVAGHVAEREREQVHVVVRQGPGHRRRPGCGEEAGMGEHRALRPPGRPARVDDPRHLCGRRCVPGVSRVEEVVVGGAVDRDDRRDARRRRQLVDVARLSEQDPGA